MNHFRQTLGVLTGIACAAAMGDASAADTAAEPFQAYVSVGISHDDNVFRLQDSAEGLDVLGIEDLADWYTTITAGFESIVVRESQSFELLLDVFRQDYNDFADFDHTGGRLRGAWNWKTSGATRGDLGFRYRRNLRDFSNTNVPLRDLVDQYTAFASVEKGLGQRWLLRIAPELTKLEFSASPLLDKQRFDLEAELKYAASQNSTFGLLATMTQSSFDWVQAQDFSGWFIGPSIHWQHSPDLKITASIGHTHQELDVPQPGVEDFNGVTGFVVADFRSRKSLSWKLRLFRDISDLGGEIPRFTKRTGASLMPTWKITPMLTGRMELGYERRDFIAFSSLVTDRDDNFSVQKLWLDLRLAERWLISAGIGRESRTSNVPIQEFDAVTAQLVVRFDF